MEMIGALYNAVSKCTRVSEEYTDDSIIMTVSTDSASVDDVTQQLTDATRGAAKSTVVTT